MKKIFIIFSVLLTLPSYAHNCIVHKTTPKIELGKPEYQKNIFASKTLDSLHGNVHANLVSNYDIVVEMLPTNGGYCVVLKQVDALFGFDNFDIEIDRVHELNSCTYNAVLNHEEKHIKVYLGIIEDLKSEIHNSLFSAADSVMPIFIEKESDIDFAFNKLNDNFSSHPDLLLISQKVHAAQEIRNKQIDRNENNTELNSCYN